MPTYIYKNPDTLKKPPTKKRQLIVHLAKGDDSLCQSVTNQIAVSTSVKDDFTISEDIPDMNHVRGCRVCLGIHDSGGVMPSWVKQA